MEDKYFWAEVGDQVMINPEYWRTSGNGRHLVRPYCANGPDYVYTITHVREDTNRLFEDELDRDSLRILHLDGENHVWTNRLKYLMPVAYETDFEITDDVSVLFNEVNT